MHNLDEYIRLSIYTAPIFVALGCVVLLVLSCGTRYSAIETRVKGIALWHIGNYILCHLAVAFYLFLPEAFVPVQSIFYLVFLWTEVLFYRLFHLLTATDNRERFSIWHYLAPLTIVGTLAVWSLFVPWEIQLEITKGLGKTLPEGYRAYGLLFISKVPMKVLWGAVYVALTIIRLVKYYRAASASSGLVRRPMWLLLLLAGLILTSVMVTVAFAYVRSKGIYLSFLLVIPSLAVIAQHIVLTYTVLRCNYTFYILSRVEEEGVPLMPEPAVQRKTSNRTSGRLLTRRSFDAWMDEHKPWLDPAYTITDMVEATDINRSYISGFINKTYGVNFNRYLNRLRLCEMERLTALPSNSGKPLKDLVGKAGFGSVKKYHTVHATERNIASEPSVEKNDEQ